MTSTASIGSRPRGAGALALEVRGLTKEYGRVPVLRGLDLELRRGEIHCLIGPGGSGKTTALSIIAGLTHPTGGTVRVYGIDVARDPARAQRHLGWLGQTPCFYDWMTGREMLQYSGRFLAHGAARRERWEDELLELAGLGEAAAIATEWYTPGMRKRLGIARALVGRPDLLLLDEPVADVPVAERPAVALMIERLRGTATVLFTSDGSSGIETLAGGCSLLPDGRGRERYA